MDSITHVALGAVVGEAIAGKRLGKRAMYYGALAQSFPDIDFVASFFLSPADNLLAHRGITHSFLFGIVATIIFAIAADRMHKPLQISKGRWVLLFAIEILLHLLLDACNAYGVGWLEPFDDKRFSFNILFVADPFYSLPIVLAMMVLIYMNSKNPSRKYWIGFALIASSCYFVHAVTNKLAVEKQVNQSLTVAKSEHIQVVTTPTPLNSWLWYVIVEEEDGFHTGYRSVWDSDAKETALTFFPKQNHLLKPFENNHDAVKLKKFSQGLYTIEKWDGDMIIFNDLRFGQIAGWDDPQAPFVFHYYLNNPAENLLVIQRGRFSNWNRKTFSSFIDRIRGD